MKPESPGIKTSEAKIDETDLEIIRLLEEDSRRSYQNIGENVHLAKTSVSSRIQKLIEMGVIREYTIQIDHTQIDDVLPVLITLELDADSLPSVKEGLLKSNRVQRIYTTAFQELIIFALPPRFAIGAWIQSNLHVDGVLEYDVRLVSDYENCLLYEPSKSLLSCAECGKPVNGEGVAKRIGDTLEHFCCADCEADFRDRYDDRINR